MVRMKENELPETFCSRKCFNKSVVVKYALKKQPNINNSELFLLVSLGVKHAFTTRIKLPSNHTAEWNGNTTVCYVLNSLNSVS